MLLSNIIEDAMEWDDKDDFGKKKGEPKGPPPKETHSTY